MVVEQVGWTHAFLFRIHPVGPLEDDTVSPDCVEIDNEIDVHVVFDFHVISLQLQNHGRDKVKRSLYRLSRKNFPCPPKAALARFLPH